MAQKKGKSQLTVGVSPYGHHINGYFPFSPLFSKRIDVIQNGGVHGIDALVLWGGTDIHPSLYGQKPNMQSQVKDLAEPSTRDQIEWWLLQQAHTNGIPVIGVCRGAQLLCAFAGGALWQHTNGHNKAHDITTSEGQIFKLVPADHHQMMDLRNTSSQVLAWATHRQSTFYDAEIVDASNKNAVHVQMEPEVVFFPGTKSLAIQPHPEWINNTEDDFNVWVNQQIQNLLLT